MPARAVQRRGEEGRRRARAVVSAGSVVVRDLQHRRQHRHQRRRAVLREVRRHHRLRAGHAGGARRRHRGAAGRPAAEGCCGAEPDEAVRRQRGHAGRRHRGDAAAAARAARVAASWWPRSHSVEAAVERRARRSPRGSGRRCWSSWTRWRSTPSRTSCGWVWTATAAAMLVAGVRRARPRRRRGRRDHGRGVRRTRCDGGVFDRRPRRGRGVRRRPAVRIPAVEAKGSLLLEDVGVPLPALGELVDRDRAASPPNAT